MFHAEAEEETRRIRQESLEKVSQILALWEAQHRMQYEEWTMEASMFCGLEIRELLFKNRKTYERFTLHLKHLPRREIDPDSLREIHYQYNFFQDWLVILNTKITNIQKKMGVFDWLFSSLRTRNAHIISLNLYMPRLHQQLEIIKNQLELKLTAGSIGLWRELRAKDIEKAFAPLQKEVDEMLVQLDELAT